MKLLSPKMLTTFFLLVVHSQSSWEIPTSTGGEDLFFQEETAGWNGSFASLTASGHRANDNEMIQDLPRTLEEAGVSLLPPPLLLPSDSPGHLSDRYPRFEDASGYANVTVQLGGTAFLNCRVLDLQEKTVSWVRRHDQELHLLTVGMQTYSTDSRFSLHFQQPNDYRLQIKYARPVDEGIYECQITMHPPRIYTVRLIVIVPSVEMVDDHGRVIEEKIYKAGSTIELKCVVSKVPGPTANVLWRHGARLLNYDTSRGGISVKTDLLPYGAVSRLYLANAAQRDAGNYTCTISESSWTTVVVHILNGEHPAAMQHGQSSCCDHRAFSMTVTIATVLVVLVCPWMSSPSRR